MGGEQSLFSGEHYNETYLYVKTDKPFYTAGERVYGKIYIRPNQVIQPKHIEIKVKGKEKVSFMRREQKEEGEEVWKEKSHRKILHFDGNCFEFQNELYPGQDYGIWFDFGLPSELPASIMYHQKHDYDQPKAVIKYTIRARLKMHHGRHVDYKQMLVIHEPPVEFLQNAQSKVCVPISTGCFSAQGECEMECRFEKNIFYSNETAVADICVNNAKCNIPVNEIEFQVVQNLELKHYGMFGEGARLYRSFDILENQDHSGVPANHQELAVKRMALNLGEIRYSISEHREKKGKPRSADEMFMLTQVAPACHSKHVQNNYVLNSNVKFDGCTCCSSLPSISVPLTIVPLTNPYSYGFPEPAGFGPQQLGQFSFNLTTEFEF